MIQHMLAIWPLVPLPFLNPTCTFGSSQFTYCWSLAWRILNIILLGCALINCTIVQFNLKMNAIWTFFGIAFLWDWNENWPFQSCGHCWVFQICRHNKCSTFTASSFRIWNSSAGIPSPPLLLFIVMLPKAHLTSHSRISGSRWVTTQSWLSGSLNCGNFFKRWKYQTT